jgi:hypothetical protein
MRKRRFISGFTNTRVSNGPPAPMLYFCLVVLLLLAGSFCLVGREFGQGPTVAHRVQSVLVTLRPTGFWPSQITRPKGPFFLLFQNRSSLEAAELHIDRVAGQQLHSATMPKKKLISTELLDLDPGQYVIKETNHPGWVCTITILAK